MPFRKLIGGESIVNKPSESFAGAYACMADSLQAGEERFGVRQGEAEQGRAVFAQLLHEHPAYRLDASVFRPDVVAAFEAQKRIANR